ncbi:transcriptional regulator PadR family protein [Gemmatirosa kalamazoonensis]|jgi:DNA-binding PadR family transcriptional regulator|uniref:Transcriptional regulator PadR family protein n=1 Tax=Gemmatirosa kalamazoonensis TaxID=861299 RepID=W0R9M5_9BACT|nr:helix-turn-helix transcriptional regulator [Gemmatirosa kalamazoonensis]AHG87794.1 transcriptional regulator PadR family protein [Gemmatirosa kalamazoonensis]
MDSSSILRRHLPLKADVLMILLALRDGERHGYAIMQDASLRSEGAVRLQPGALYRTLKRLVDDGLVVESARRPAPERDDERRRYYRLTPLGGRVVAAEMDRLARLVAGASGARPRLA